VTQTALAAATDNFFTVVEVVIVVDSSKKMNVGW
jgi:hypothetical protein